MAAVDVADQSGWNRRLFASIIALPSRKNAKSFVETMFKKIADCRPELDQFGLQEGSRGCFYT